MWYYQKNGEKIGPVDDLGIQGLAQSGKISAETLVWKKGYEKWAYASRTELSILFNASSVLSSKATPPPLDKIAGSRVAREEKAQDKGSLAATKVISKEPPRKVGVKKYYWLTILNIGFLFILLSFPFSAFKNVMPPWVALILFVTLPISLALGLYKKHRDKLAKLSFKKYYQLNAGLFLAAFIVCYGLTFVGYGTQHYSQSTVKPAPIDLAVKPAPNDLEKDLEKLLQWEDDDKGAAKISALQDRIWNLESELSSVESETFRPARAGEQVYVPTYNKMYGSVAEQRRDFNTMKATKIASIERKIRVLQGKVESLQRQQ